MSLWFICVVVNSLSQVIFAFRLFLGMIMYANEVATKENKKLPEITKTILKIQHFHSLHHPNCLIINN